MGRRAANALTAKAVQTSTKLGYTADAMQPGLNLQVVQGAAGFVRSWVFRYTSPVTRKRREIGIGPVHTRSLADARAEAARFRQQILDGLDPKDERDRQRLDNVLKHSKRLTFEEAAERCIAARQHEWKNAKHRHQWTASLKAYAYPSLGKLPVEQITKQLVFAVLDPIWTTKTETATRVRQRIETVMDWAKAGGFTAGDNPASLKGGLGHLLPKASKVAKVEHHPALPYVQAHAFVQALRAKRGIAAKALEFLFLTASRSGEVLGATWGEIDLVGKVWTIPGERMKAGREHRVPLSSRAVTILKDLLPGRFDAFVFANPSGRKGLSNAAMLALMRGMDDFSGYVPHGLRSTFRDWASETTSYANETLELALAHTIKNQAEAAYRRGDQLEKRAKLMEQWAQYVERVPQSGTVTALRAKSSA